MPKALYPVRDFSGGINNLKDPSDIQDNELSDAQNIMFTRQGVIDSGLSMKDTSNNKVAALDTSHIDAIEGGYGLGYFETDHFADGTARSLTLTGNAANRGFRFVTNPSAKDNKHTVTAFSDGDDKVNYNQGANAVAGTAINLHNWFPSGTEIILSGFNMDGSGGTGYAQTIADGSMDGIYTVIGGNGSTEIYLDRATPPQIDTELGGTGVANILQSCSGTMTGILSGDKIVLIAHPEEHKIDVYSNSVTDYTEDAITLQGFSTDDQSSKVLYYKSEDQIRCCDTNVGTKGKIQWFGWISRTHFKSSLNSKSYSGYFAKDNDLAPPSHTGSNMKYFSSSDNSSHAFEYPQAGAGFTLRVFSSDSAGAIEGGEYEFAQSFIYDDNQESLLALYGKDDTTKASTENTSLTHTDLKSLKIQIGAKGDYDSRISGGRIYIRKKDSDDEFTLLVDIDLTKGARTSLEGDFTDWKQNSGDEHYIGTSVTDYLEVTELSLLNYEIINGYPSSIFTNHLGGDGENWQDAVVSNNRVFVCNVRTADKSKGSNKIVGHANAADLTVHPDMIMYSMPNRLDTFPSFNTIDAAKGDADHYMAVESYADRLLAYKRNSMDIINISSPSDANWFLEDTKNLMGVEHHGAVYKTQYGVVWVNKNGLYLYTGNAIQNLSENKIDDDVWGTFFSNNTIIIYDELKSLVYVIKNCTSDGDAYAYDLKRGNFTFLKDFTHDGITNPVVSNLISSSQSLVAIDAGSSLEFYQHNRTPVAMQNISFKTKNFDFNQPNRIKKLYAVHVEYKSTADISSKIKYSKNGGYSFESFSSGSSTTGTNNWIKGKWSLDTPAESSTYMLELDTTTTSATVFINNITFEYRLVKKLDNV
mgnify:CR=1 FL=1